MNNTNEALEVLQETEDVYTYLLRVYNIQDDLTRCTLWQMVKDGLFKECSYVITEPRWMCCL